MATEPTNFVINRVVIALDSVCEYLTPIETAADLASRLHAELHGVFVEDVDLLRVAELPFTRQVALARESTRPLERATIEAEFRALARRARHCLEKIAAARRINWSFEVFRGERSGYAPPTSSSELLVLDNRTRAFAGRVRLPVQKTSFSPAGWRATALLGPGAMKAPRVIAVIDATPTADRVLEAARGLVGGDLRALTVLGPTGTSKRVFSRKGSQIDVPFIQDIPELNSQRLRTILRAAGAGITVIPLSLAQSGNGPLFDLISDPPCTIVLVA